jgi:hypothetical protein
MFALKVKGLRWWMLGPLSGSIRDRLTCNALALIRTATLSPAVVLARRALDHHTPKS